MTKVRVKYDGWLSLPVAVRRKLGLLADDQLELELADGGVFLRPVRPGAGVRGAAPEPVVPAEPAGRTEPAPPATAATDPVVRRGPGRPRKTPLPVIPPTLKARGGKRKAAAAAAP